MDNIKSTNIKNNKQNTENIKKEKNLFDIALNIIQKQIINFDTNPDNHFSRMNNEEIMRE